MVKTLETSGESTVGKKTFTEKEKAAAVRLLKNGYTLKEAATEVGCSVASLQNWKKNGVKANLKHEAETGGNPSSRTKGNVHSFADDWTPAEPEPAPCPEPAHTPGISFGELLQAYWRQHKDDIVHTNKIREIHSILEFAYKQMTK